MKQSKHHFPVLDTRNSSKEVNLSIKEHLLTSATDMVECLRTDPSKVGRLVLPKNLLVLPKFVLLRAHVIMLLMDF